VPHTLDGKGIKRPIPAFVFERRTIQFPAGDRTIAPRQIWIASPQRPRFRRSQSRFERKDEKWV
jgi:hypothetical protein